MTCYHSNLSVLLWSLEVKSKLGFFEFYGTTTLLTNYRFCTNTTMSLLRISLSRTPFTFRIQSYSTTAFPFANPPALRTLCTPEDMKAAQAWVDGFRTATSPSAKCLKDTGTFAYARSSGPGGQNVNKVNTKAIFRVPVMTTEGGVAVRWIPLWALDGLVKDPRYALSSQSLVLSSDAHRSQSANVEECLDKVRLWSFVSCSSRSLYMGCLA